jgi:methylmalonyl-CoA mutase N-terminal domain/subunit
MLKIRNHISSDSILKLPVAVLQLNNRKIISSELLGGTQSLHTNSMDETYALPTEKAVKIALRTQQLIAYETGAANTIDPLGGSYYVEALTDKLEKLTFEYFDKIETLGGVVPAIEKGFFQREISRSAYEYQKALEKKEKYHVGVNIFEEKENVEIDLLKIPDAQNIGLCSRICYTWRNVRNFKRSVRNL